MTAEQLAAQRELDRDIVAFVREMRDAPVLAAAVDRFVQDIRRRRVRPGQVEDRMKYLASAGKLRGEDEWIPGEGWQTTYTCTAEGMDALDGAIPWDERR